MPNLSFEITGVQAVTRGLAPLLHFRLRIASLTPGDAIEGLLLSAQIQLQCPLRSYTPVEKDKLVELFGAPEDWGRSLRNRLLSHSHTTVGAFRDTTETVLPVACTYDLNLAGAKFLYLLEGGEIPLLFLFSGSVFYSAQPGRLQVERLSWSKECSYRMPVQVWRDLMEHHYPNSAWLSLRRDVFDRLYEFRRRNGMATWEQTIERLLDNSPSQPHSAASNRELQGVPA